MPIGHSHIGTNSPGGGGGASALSDLSDVTSAAVTNQFVLVADSAAYVGRALLEADISDFGTYLTTVQLSTLTDVGVTTPTDRNALMADGDSWESRALVEADISDLQSYGFGDVTKVGTPIAKELGFWTGDGTLGRDTNLTWEDDTRGMLRITCPLGFLSEQGLHMVSLTGSINTAGWMQITGQQGLFDGAFMISQDPSDVVNNRNVTHVFNNATVYGRGAKVADNASFGSESSGALAFYMPYDTTGREEGKISARGHNPGFADEGLLSVEIYNYQGGTPTLTFTRHTQFVVTNIDRIRLDCYGSLHAGVLTGDAQSDVNAGDNAAMGSSSTLGLLLTGQGSTNDITIYNDAKVIVGHLLTGTIDFIFDGELGVGNVVPTAQLHVDQFSSSGAKPVVRLDQADVDDTFIDFIGTSAADGTRSISSDTTEDSTKFGAIRVEINGVTKWIRIYDDES